MAWVEMRWHGKGWGGMGRDEMAWEGVRWYG